MCVFSHDVFSETIMFLHEIFHQGLKARIANWPTLVLGKLRLDDTQNTHIHTVCIRSAAVQLHQGQVFSLSNSNVTLDVLLAHSLSLSHTHTHTHTHTHFPISVRNRHTHCLSRQWPAGPEGIPRIHLLKQKHPRQISITKETDGWKTRKAMTCGNFK